MASRVLVDTDVLIDAARGEAGAVQRLSQETAAGAVGISTVSHLEMLVGCRNKLEQRQIGRFIRRFEHIRIDPRVSDMAVQLLQQYRLSHGLLIADALIAATAVSVSIPLLTRNMRDSRFIAGLVLATYP